MTYVGTYPAVTQHTADLVKTTIGDRRPIDLYIGIELVSVTSKYIRFRGELLNDYPDITDATMRWLFCATVELAIANTHTLALDSGAVSPLSASVVYDEITNRYTILRMGNIKPTTEMAFRLAELSEQLGLGVVVAMNQYTNALCLPTRWAWSGAEVAVHIAVL